MDTQLHLIEHVAPRNPPESSDSGRADASPRTARRPARTVGKRPRRPAPVGPNVHLSAEVRAAGLRGVAEAREALNAARRRVEAEAESREAGQSRHHPSAA